MAKTKDIAAKNPQITGPGPKTHVPEEIPEQEAPDRAPLPRKTKSALLRDMLCDPAGVSLQCLMLATGWQSHTVRAAISGLRKGGLNVSRTSGEDGPIYITAPASGSSSKAVVASIAGTRPRKTTVREAGDPKTPPFATAGIASGVKDAAAPVSTDALDVGANAASAPPDGVAS